MSKVYLLMQLSGEQYEQSYTSVLWVGTRKPTHCELRAEINSNLLVSDMCKILNGESHFFWKGRDGITVWIDEMELVE